jgi:hypothetical protein
MHAPDLTGTGSASTITSVETDELLRLRCFLALDALRARIGDELPYLGALDAGFEFDGRRIAFMNRFKGIHRAKEQRGQAALSVMTSSKNPYEDRDTDDGLAYAYRTGDVDQPDNRALRSAAVGQEPMVYFIGTRPGWFEALYPAMSSPTTLWSGACC